jgi:hypothetical protein
MPGCGATEEEAVFTVRPVVLHFALWVLLAPLFLLEARALEQLAQTLALQDTARIRRTLAEVTAERSGPSGPEIRYQFTIAGRTERFAAMNTAGWGEPWVPLSPAAWERAHRQNGLVEVVYLPENPAANQPVARAGYPIGDSAFSWSLFLIVDLIWLVETTLMIRNFLRCQTAAERREACRMRFWRTAQLPTAIDRYARAARRTHRVVR